MEDNFLEQVDSLCEQAHKITSTCKQIEYSKILPAKEGIMLLRGKKYLTGADYGEMRLNQIIN